MKSKDTKMKYIIKKGVNHHPHSLEDPVEIVEFIEEQTRMISYA